MDRKGTAGSTQDATRQLVSFSLDREEFGVDILKVQEIVKLQKIARVPRSPEFVEGVINLRGNVIPVVDLRRKFGLPAAERAAHNRIIVFNIREKMVGVLVDRVEKVLRIPEDQIVAPPEVGGSGNQSFITGIGKLGENLVTLVDIEIMLEDQEVFDLNEIGAAREAVQNEPASLPAAAVPAGNRKSARPKRGTRASKT